MKTKTQNAAHKANATRKNQLKTALEENDTLRLCLATKDSVIGQLHGELKAKDEEIQRLRNDIALNRERADKSAAAKLVTDNLLRKTESELDLEKWAHELTRNDLTISRQAARDLNHKLDQITRIIQAP